MAGGRLLPPLLLLLLPVAAANDGPDGLRAIGLCSLPRASGDCRAWIPRWWFNASSGVCQSFVYGGCDGNANNFNTEQECRERCGTAALGNSNRLPEQPAAVNAPDGNLGAFRASAVAPDPCGAPALTGPCRASFPRWFYIPANGTCRIFTYGGCRGNGNNFQSHQECLSRCQPRKGDAEADFTSSFFSSKVLALGILLAVLAALVLVSGMDLVLKLCRKKAEVPGMPLGWSPGDDKEYLMSNAYTL
ncbi:kunitz-type protease inhibitor 2 [Cuculus canorus]|uniref:kunitz-type protease inhibitor 2 n=1 Tax=Cuculus canorus TaxID=55661 RepID=UPI0023AA70E1|nr:kunitz-type protease inhibitor 2 [Cuculus canorus]